MKKISQFKLAYFSYNLSTYLIQFLVAAMAKVKIE